MAWQQQYVLSSGMCLYVHYAWKPMQAHVAEQGQAGNWKLNASISVTASWRAH